jgi:hypothetical protein
MKRLRQQNCTVTEYPTDNLDDCTNIVTVYEYTIECIVQLHKKGGFTVVLDEAHHLYEGGREHQLILMTKFRAFFRIKRIIFLSGTADIAFFTRIGACILQGEPNPWKITEHHIAEWGQFRPLYLATYRHHSHRCSKCLVFCASINELIAPTEWMYGEVKRLKEYECCNY